MNNFYRYNSFKRHVLVCFMLACTTLLSFNVLSNPADSSRTRKTILKGRAVLPAATFSPGPTSGKLVFPKVQNGQTLPLINKQPVQGFSAVRRDSDTSYWVMCDNGYGILENSSDFNLRVYNIRPDFKTAKGGTGNITVKKFIELSDPDSLIPFSIVNQYTRKRILTGADFDIESMQKAKDNTLWFGDEFGPYLIHTDTTGKLLDAPYVLPDPSKKGKEIRSFQNQYYEEASAVRIMNAMNTNIVFNGGSKTPVVSPNYNLIDDKDTNTALANRKTPPAGSGLSKASSEIFNIASIQSAGYPLVAWTVNDSLSITKLIKAGVNGIISDNPELLKRLVSKYDGDSNSIPDFIDKDGLIDITKFDAQAHRGGRALRPENTLPAMENALDLLLSTLETDCGVTSDGVAVLSHDAYLSSTKFRKADGTPYMATDEVLIKSLTLAQLQSTYIGDKLLGTAFPLQKNDKALSPVAVAFATAKGLADPYVCPSLQQLFDFVKFYSAYYKTGAGSTHAQAALRSKNADRVRFNIETKRNPRSDADSKGNIYKTRTVDAVNFAKIITNVILTNQLTERADLQSFDFSTLLAAHTLAPAIRTVFLFSDGPVAAGSTEDGTNLQPEPKGVTSPWLGGLYWPYRSTYLSTPVRAQRSGGFEGMALDSSRENLLALLELPLLPVSSKKEGNPIFEFNLATKSYTGNLYKYNFSSRGTNIGDFVMYSKTRGLVIEREGSQGDLNGLKAIYEIQLNGNGKSVSKRLAADLLNITDNSNITTANTDDIGLGERFSFPFTTIEDVVILGPTTLGVLNDNNYPGSVGRHIKNKLSDDNEFIIIETDRKLGSVPMAAEDTLGYYPAANITGFAEGSEEEEVLTSVKPNPFSTTTSISFHLPQSAQYAISICNNMGQKIKTFSDTGSDKGIVQVEWDGTNDQRSKVIPGIYHLQLNIQGKIYQHKLMVTE